MDLMMSRKVLHVFQTSLSWKEIFESIEMLFDASLVINILLVVTQVLECMAQELQWPDSAMAVMWPSLEWGAGLLPMAFQDRAFALSIYTGAA